MSEDRPLGDEASPSDPTEAADEKPMEEEEENPWAAIKPWEGKSARLDKVLLVLIIGVPFIYLGLMPFRPWMLVNAPVLQEFINGAKTAVVAGAAYARVGEIPLWLVVFAGFIGMAKLDWAPFWLAGRRWGDGILRLFWRRTSASASASKQASSGSPSWALLPHDRRRSLPGSPRRPSSTWSPDGRACAWRPS